MHARGDRGQSNDASEVAYDQLALSQVELKKAQVKVEVSQLRDEAVTTEIETSQARIWKLEAVLEGWAKSDNDGELLSSCPWTLNGP